MEDTLLSLSSDEQIQKVSTGIHALNQSIGLLKEEVSQLDLREHDLTQSIGILKEQVQSMEALSTEVRALNQSVGLLGDEVSQTDHYIKEDVSTIIDDLSQSIGILKEQVQSMEAQPSIPSCVDEASGEASGDASPPSDVCVNADGKHVVRGLDDLTSTVTDLSPIPPCSQVHEEGHVCIDDTSAIVVKGLKEFMASVRAAFDLTDGSRIEFHKHLIPSQNSLFDIGNAEQKVRHLFLSDT